MTVRGIRVAALVLFGIGIAGVTGRAVLAQALKAKESPKVSAQIIAADQEDDFIKGAVDSKTPGLVAPIATHRVHPKYTPSTLRAKLQGDVAVEAIIGVDGRVEKSRIKKSLDPELDAEALKAIGQWQFEAGLLNGRPTRVLVEVDLTFRVH